MTFRTCSLREGEFRSSSKCLEISFLGRSLWNEERKLSSEFLGMGFLIRSFCNKQLWSCEFLDMVFLTWFLKLMSSSTLFELGLLTCSLRDKKSRSSSGYLKTGFLTGSPLQKFGLIFCSIFIGFSAGMPSSLSSWNFFLASSCMEWAYIPKHSTKCSMRIIKSWYCKRMKFFGTVYLSEVNCIRCIVLHRVAAN